MITTPVNNSTNVEYLNLYERQNVLLREISERNTELSEKLIEERILHNDLKFKYSAERYKNGKLSERLDLYSSIMDDNENYQSLLKFKIRMYEIRNVVDNTTKNIDCCICYDNLKKSVITKCCKTEMCMECLCKWSTSNQNCPMCRTEL
jgi:hypothetical protein